MIARRFFCQNEKCERKLFNERFDEVLAPYQRRTHRLNESLIDISQAAGGEGGARLAKKLGMIISPDTLIRLILKNASSSDPPSVRILGVDDWAFRKGHDYGTILVDLERKCPVDLLPDRSADSFERWLKGHPGVEVISRDRASCYSKGGKDGAPNAIQVADRWHLLKNLGDTAQKLFAKYPKQIKAATNQSFNEAAAEPPHDSIALEKMPNIQSEPQPKSRRELIFDDVKLMQAEGLSNRAIAKELGISRTTVRKYSFLSELPPKAIPLNTHSKASPFKDYLLQRWREGERNGKVLCQEIKVQGFEGSPSSVYRILSKFAGYAEDKKRRPPAQKKVASLSPRKVAKLFSRDETDLKETELKFCKELKSLEPEIRIAHSLIQDFSKMIKERLHGSFEGWLIKAQDSGLSDFEGFAKGLRSDYDAVYSALSLPWSNGQVEGQVNRLKTIKRTMYGRSRFELLKKRVLWTSG